MGLKWIIKIVRKGESEVAIKWFSDNKMIVTPKKF